MKMDRRDKEDERIAGELVLSLHELDNRKNECDISEREIVRV
jgi:hypothetical protein